MCFVIKNDFKLKSVQCMGTSTGLHSWGVGGIRRGIKFECIGTPYTPINKVTTNLDVLSTIFEQDIIHTLPQTYWIFDHLPALRKAGYSHEY